MTWVFFKYSFDLLLRAFSISQFSINGHIRLLILAMTDYSPRHPSKKLIQIYFYCTEFNITRV